MKTLFLTREYPPHIYGGAGVHVDYLSKSLSKLMPVEVRCFGKQNNAFEQLQVQGFPFEKEECIDSKLNPIFDSLQTNIQMNRSGTDAQVVHCHTWYVHFSGILAKLCYGIPLVITAHSLEPLRPWKREQLGRGYDASLWIEKTALEMADAVIAVSQETKEDILKNFKVRPDKVKVIHNGVDLEEYKHTRDNSVLKRFKIDQNRPYVLFVGRITRQKGIVHLLDAISFLSPKTQVVLCAGAPDTEEIALEMKSRIREIQKTRKGVVWIEQMLPKRDIIQLYSHASVFCCPSVYEPFGIINIEAMSCGAPVVGSAVGGIKEIVVHGETGFLVPFEKSSKDNSNPAKPIFFAKELAKAIEQITSNAKLRTQMSIRGRTRVEKHFGWDSIARQVKTLYETLIA